jgi:23S rRNA U2552 (ribose-2'-O)-methylase RlmE/FtsJ
LSRNSPEISSLLKFLQAKKPSKTSFQAQAVFKKFHHKKPHQKAAKSRVNYLFVIP